MQIHKAAILLAICLSAVTTTSNAALSTSWTLTELHQGLLEAEKSEDALKALLAEKVYEEMHKQGIRFVNNDLVYSTTEIPAWRSGTNAYNSDGSRDTVFDVVNALSPVKSVGSCSVPLATGFSLLGVEGSDVGFTGQLYGDETNFLLNASSGKIQIGVYAEGKVSSSAALKLAWGGTYPVPGTEYRCDIPVPPYPCGSLLKPKVCHTVCGYVPTVEMVCEEWKDGAGLKAEAEIKGSIIATLDTSYSVSDRQIVINKNLTLSGDIYSINGSNSDYPYFSVSNRLVPYVTPDINALTGPTLSSPISAQVFAQIVHMPVAAGSAALGALGPLVVSAPPELQSAIAYVTMREGTLLGLSLVGFEQNYVNEQYQAYLEQQNADFDEKGHNEPIIIDLPEDIDDQLLEVVLNLLNQSGFTGFLKDFTRDNLHEILYYLLTDDRAGLEALFTSAAACEAVEELVASMSVVPLYAKNASGTCEVADVYGDDRGQYFSDLACTNEVAYRPTPNLDYCRLAMAGSPNADLGNAASWQPDYNQANDPTPIIPSRKWTQWLGTRIPISADPINNNSSPYMKQVKYRDVTSAGHADSCELEMRIYKKDITSQNRPALIAMHGGSWTYRGAAFTALETTISHYTERGFIVFVPFYRLVEDNDANPACNGATWQEVVADAEAALDWVKYYAPMYGAKPGRIAVTGQSAGGHLAEWLITHRSDDISAGMLHYPPIDAYDLLSNAYIGGLYEAWMPSLGILSDFFGTDVTQIDLDTPPEFILQNSLARLVQDSTLPMPPVFLLHGTSDPLVPSNQSVLLCNAYGGNAVNDGGGTSLRAIYDCGDSGGQLHLFEEGVHGLDACVTNGLCLSGSLESASLVADSSRKGRDWLYERTALPVVLPVSNIMASTGTGNKVMDGDLGSSWVAKGGDYLVFDLSISRPIGAVGVVWGGGQTVSTPAFAIETSNDNLTWTEVYTGQASGITQDIEVFDFTKTYEARYVRFLAISSDQSTPIRVAELRLYSPEIPGPIPSTLKQSTAPTLLGVATTDDGQWNTYDFGGAYEIAHVMFSVPENEKVEIEFSMDGASWKAVPISQGPGNDRLVDIRDINARAIRVKAPRNRSVSGDVSFTVYGSSIESWQPGSGPTTGTGGSGSIDWSILLLGALLLLYRRLQYSPKY